MEAFYMEHIDHYASGAQNEYIMRLNIELTYYSNRMQSTRHLHETLS